jgi:secreted trypsin-like serine protease
LAYLSLDTRYFTLAMKPSQGLDAVCQGDSGGARLIKKDNDWALVGITSWGDIPCVATDTVARIDTASALDFLNGVINTVDSDNTCTEARYLE